MKKILLLGVAALTLAACGGGSSYTPTVSTPMVPEPTPVEPEPDIPFVKLTPTPDDPEVGTLNVDVDPTDTLQDQLISILGHQYWILTDGPSDYDIADAKRKLTEVGFINADEVVDFIAWHSTPTGAPPLRIRSVLDDIDLTTGIVDSTAASSYNSGYRQAYSDLSTAVFADAVFLYVNGYNVITFDVARSYGYNAALYRSIDNNRDGLVTVNELANFSVLLDAIPQNEDELYEFLDVKGLRDVHEQGWTGYGKIIGVYDSGHHGIIVGFIAQSVAPGAGVLYTGEGSNTRIYGADVTNHSYGWTTTGAVSAISHLNQVNDDNPDALHVLSGPNTNTWCFNDQDVTTCDAEAKAFKEGYLEGEYIFVGAYDDSPGGYNSYASGDQINGHWIVANGDGHDGTVGSSYAAPRVAGAAALIRHKFPNVSAGDTKAILIHTADDTFDGYNANTHGQGMLDVGAALSPVGDVQ